MCLDDMLDHLKRDLQKSLQLLLLRGVPSKNTLAETPGTSAYDAANVSAVDVPSAATAIRISAAGTATAAEPEARTARAVRRASARADNAHEHHDRGEHSGHDDRRLVHRDVSEPGLWAWMWV